MARFFRLVSHVRILAAEELRDLIFRKRAFLSLLLYLGVIALVVTSLSAIEGKLAPSLGIFSGGVDRSGVVEQASKRGLLSYYEVIAYISAWPSPVVIMQALSLVWFPTLVALVSCDMVAIDIYRGTLRFLLLRTSRLAYYISKLVAHTMLYLILHVLTVLALVIVAALRDPSFDLGLYAASLSRYAIVLVPFFLFLVASTQFVSSWSAKPMNAVVRLHLLWVAFFGVLFIAPWASPLWLPVSTGLIAPVQGFEWTTVFGMLGWAAGFFLLGLALFLRRPL